MPHSRVSRPQASCSRKFDQTADVSPAFGRNLALQEPGSGPSLISGGPDPANVADPSHESSDLEASHVGEALSVIRGVLMECTLADVRKITRVVQSLAAGDTVTVQGEEGAKSIVGLTVNGHDSPPGSGDIVKQTLPIDSASPFPVHLLVTEHTFKAERLDNSTPYEQSPAAVIYYEDEGEDMSISSAEGHAPSPTPQSRVAPAAAGTPQSSTPAPVLMLLLASSEVVFAAATDATEMRRRRASASGIDQIAPQPLQTPTRHSLPGNLEVDETITRPFAKAETRASQARKCGSHLRTHVSVLLVPWRVVYSKARSRHAYLCCRTMSGHMRRRTATLVRARKPRMAFYQTLEIPGRPKHRRGAVGAKDRNHTLFDERQCT